MTENREEAVACPGPRLKQAHLGPDQAYIGACPGPYLVVELIAVPAISHCRPNVVVGRRHSLGQHSLRNHGRRWNGLQRNAMHRKALQRNALQETPWTDRWTFGYLGPRGHGSQVQAQAWESLAQA